MSSNQSVDEERPTRLVNQTIANNVNIRDVSHVTVVTSVQPRFTGACGLHSFVISVQV